MSAHSEVIGHGVSALRSRTDLPHGVFSTLMLSGNSVYEPNPTFLHADPECYDLHRPKFDPQTNTDDMYMTGCGSCVSSFAVRDKNAVLHARWGAWLRAVAAFGAAEHSHTVLTEAEAAVRNGDWAGADYEKLKMWASRMVTLALRLSDHPCVPGPPDQPNNLSAMVSGARSYLPELDLLDPAAAGEVRVVLEVAQTQVAGLEQRWVEVSAQWSKALASAWETGDRYSTTSDERSLFVVPVIAGRHMIWLDDEAHEVGHAVLASTRTVARSARFVLLDLTQAQAHVIIDMVHRGILPVQPYPTTGIDPQVAKVALTMLEADLTHWERAYQAATQSLIAAVC